MEFSKRLQLAGFCVGLALLSAPAALHAQVKDLPIKPGLWETTVTVANRPAPVVARSCFTAGTTLRDYMVAVGKGTPGLQCTVTKNAGVGRNLTFDTTCTNGTVTSNSHMDFQSIDLEHFSGSSHATVSGTTGGKPMNIPRPDVFGEVPGGGLRRGEAGGGAGVGEVEQTP
jgi:hypothetical protein